MLPMSMFVNQSSMDGLPNIDIEAYHGYPPGEIFFPNLCGNVQLYKRCADYYS